MSRIIVHIDRLVLPGIESTERKALVEGLNGELARVLSDREARTGWAKPHRTPVLRLGQMPLAAGLSGSRQFGSGIARAIGKGLKP
jgi:hypothetical protein